MNDNVSTNIAAWLACLAFVVMLINGAFKLKRNATGEPSVPANPILGQNVHDITRRVKHLEDWRDGLMDKLEEDKQAILTAGEHRAVHLDSFVVLVPRQALRAHRPLHLATRHAAPPAH